MWYIGTVKSRPKGSALFIYNEVNGMPHDPHYDLAKHKAWRLKVLRNDGYLCRECKRYGKTTSASHAHHIKPRSTHPELSFDVKNGMALCSSCHSKIEPRWVPPI